MSLDEFKARCLAFVPVGSRVTCDPPPLDTDEDFLALVANSDRAGARLKAMGFVTTTDPEYKGMGSAFTSYRLDAVNVILTASTEFYKAFMVATHVAKRLNLLRKSDRIALFQAVLYRNQYEDDE